MRASDSRPYDVVCDLVHPCRTVSGLCALACDRGPCFSLCRNCALLFFRVFVCLRLAPLFCHAHALPPCACPLRARDRARVFPRPSCPLILIALCAVCFCGVLWFFRVLCGLRGHSPVLFLVQLGRWGRWPVGLWPGACGRVAGGPCVGIVVCVSIAHPVPHGHVSPNRWCCMAMLPSASLLASLSVLFCRWTLWRTSPSPASAGTLSYTLLSPLARPRGRCVVY